MELLELPRLPRADLMLLAPSKPAIDVAGDVLGVDL